MKLDDLSAAGWEVTGPAKENDGNTWVHLSRPFANPAEMKEILAEINGPGGPLGAFDLTIRKEWDETTWTLAGTAGLTGGVAGFVDADLAAAFGTSKPLEQLVAESGVPIEEGLNLTVTVTMPHQTDALVVARTPRRPRGPDRGRDGRSSSRGQVGSDHRRCLRRPARGLARLLGDPRGPARRPPKGPLHSALIDPKHRRNLRALGSTR